MRNIGITIHIKVDDQVWNLVWTDFLSFHATYDTMVYVCDRVRWDVNSGVRHHIWDLVRSQINIGC